ncbi:MAG: TnpA family transposase [Rickettsiales bacterium]|jgi:TnpA family transposase
MPRLQILSKEEIKNFDSAPKFNSSEKEKYFGTNYQIDEMVDKFKNDSNKVGFILLHGYFRACGKFINSSKFLDEDIEYICEITNIDQSEIDFSKYMNKSYSRHKKIIADLEGVLLFEEFDKKHLIDEVKYNVENQIRPRQILIKMVELLQVRKAEIPTYFVLAKFIIDEFNSYENGLSLKLESLLGKKQIDLLDNLIKISELTITAKSGDKEQDNKQKIKLDEESEEISSQYRLTLLKKPSQSTRPGKIKESIEDFSTIKNLHKQLYQVIEELKLPTKAIRYYATWAAKSKISQLTQLANPYKRYLHLISFITHQYYFRQDLFADTILTSVQSAKNSVKKSEKEEYFSSKKDRTKALKALNKSHKSFKETFEKLKKVIESEYLSNDEKVDKSIDLFELFKSQGNQDLPVDLTDIIDIETSSKNKDKKYYDLLESGSIKLQNRISSIVKSIEFNENVSGKEIIGAINNYRGRDGNVDQNAPIGFLGMEEQEALYDDKGKFRISLYKTLFFIHIADAIKSGELSLRHSYRYLSIDEYLIDKKFWIENRAELLKKAGLEEFADFDKVIKILRKILAQQYKLTNSNILSGKNKYIKFDRDGRAFPITPKVEKTDFSSASELFPKDQFYPILQILSDIDKSTNFLSCFEHHNIKYAKQKPSDKVFFGGIMGKGFDIGTNKIARTSKGININTLQNTINWYFSLDSLYAANNIVNKHIDNLSLTNIFLMNQNKSHTASDGQKFNISVDSLNSNYSFKYHGKEKGVSIYSFGDEKGRSYYNSAFSSAEREAPFMIDGLMHNDEIRSDIHSTDTHGYTETIFAATHMLGIFFAPRIKNLKKQKLYSFKDQKIKDFKDKGYKILPSEYIDEKYMRENWEDILRLIATIKLKHSSASQIFKRLSSYAKQNPLYKGLQEFGRITKTIFILKYYDDLELRQAIEKQLNLIELSHKFAKAVFFGNNQEFDVESKEEQEIIVNCRRLIQNVIVLWNYLYLTRLLMEQKDQEKQQEMIKIILNGSIITWRHVNFYGEYDFTADNQNSSDFDMEQIGRFEVRG